MAQDNQHRSEDKQGGKDQQPGGQGVQPAREGSALGNAGRETPDPESIGRQDSWRPTDDPVGERQDGENEGTGRSD
jgi:hypothetical protein